MKNARLLWFWALAAALPAPAFAADFQIAATTVAQGYEYGAADGSVVARRRIAQYIRLNGYNLIDDATGTLYFVSSFRLDSDFGLTNTDSAITGAQYLRQGIRELDSPIFSLLYAYLAGRNLWGRIDFDAGRQFMVDLVDFFHFDGVRVGVNTPWYFGVEVFGGFEVRAGAALGVSAFDLPGIAESAARAPTFGFGLYTRDLTWGRYSLFGRVTFRQTMASSSLDHCMQDALARFECDRLTVAPTTEDRNAVASAFSDTLVVDQRITASLQARLDHVHVWGGLSYNLVQSTLDDLSVGAQARFLDHLVVSGEYLRSRPRFDADSIFNIFANQQIDDVRVKVGWTFDNGYEIYGRGYVRLFHTVSVDIFRDTLETARGLVIGGKIPHGRNASTSFDLLVQAGYGGYLFGGDAWSRFALMGGKLELDGRLLVLRFDDDRLENVNGITFTVQGGARWALHRFVTLHLILEESANRLYSSNFRVYGLLDLSFWL